MKRESTERNRERVQRLKDWEFRRGQRIGRRKRRSRILFFFSFFCFSNFLFSWENCLYFSVFVLFSDTELSHCKHFSVFVFVSASSSFSSSISISFFFKSLLFLSFTSLFWGFAVLTSQLFELQVALRRIRFLFVCYSHRS